MIRSQGLQNMTHTEFKAISRASGRSDKWLAEHIGQCNIRSWQRWCGGRQKDSERLGFVYHAPPDVVARLQAYIALHGELVAALPVRVKYLGFGVKK